MNKYEITISENHGVIEDYKQARDYIASFKICDENNNDISNRYEFVHFWISNSGMIGLGTELIRLAHNFEEGKEVTIVPSSKQNGAQQSMGVFLTPESCKLIIKCARFETIDYYAEEPQEQTEKFNK